MSLKTKYIGDRAFYRTAMNVAIPMMIQNVITNFVNMLDNIMVGRIGTLQMSGVSIVNQLFFVFNLCIFGAISGAGIFTAQFAGKGDHEGVRYSFRFKLQIAVIITVVGTLLFLLKGDALISLYLQSDSSAADLAATMAYGKDYMYVLMTGLLAFALSNAYSATMRETGQTIVPMVSGVAAVLVNLVFNYILIFGHFGAPAMGVKGAAIATVLSRYVELGINAIWLHRHSERYPYVKKLYASLHIPGNLYKRIALKGLPLLANETLWSAGMAIMNQCYSTRGLDVVAANNISGTVWNLFSVSFITLGNAVAIIIGHMLGAGEPKEKVRDTDTKLIVFSVMVCGVFAVILAVVAGQFPLIYNTTESVRTLATKMILVSAAMMPFSAYTNAAYFTLRSGGRMLVTVLFDSCFVWVICVPLAFFLSRFTAMPIIPLFIFCQCTEVAKCIMGYLFVRTDTWMQNITTKD